MRYDVALAACKSYEDAEVSAALETAVTAAGGLDWVTPGMRVALKLNLVSAMKPEKAATVHPAVVCALVRMLQARGAHVVLGDSPGGLYNAAHLQRVYDVTGLRAAEALGAELNGDFSVCSVSYPEAVQARSFTETAYLRNADAIIDVCKLKTHGMMGMTNAVKNFFGIIPGTMKPEYHYKYPKIEDFANMIVDLCEYCKPRLCICDAVVGMEGNGPSGGRPRPLGLTLCAPNPFALDLLASDLIGFSADEVETVRLSAEQGLCPPQAGLLHVVGEQTAPWRCSFERAASGDVTFSSRIPGPLQKPLRRLLAPRPVIDAARCIGCGECAASCPPQTITLREGKAHIGSGQCIRCFCCQEMCPVKAIDIRKFFGFRM